MTNSAQFLASYGCLGLLIDNCIALGKGGGECPWSATVRWDGARGLAAPQSEKSLGEVTSWPCNRYKYRRRPGSSATTWAFQIFKRSIMKGITPR